MRRPSGTLPSLLLRALSASARFRGLAAATLVALSVSAAAGLRACERERLPLRVGTFNIREFGHAPGTDLERLRELLREPGAAVLAVQEIQHELRFRELVQSLPGRWRYALAQCGGRGVMFVGFLWDESRVRELEREEYPELLPGGGRCTGGDRAGLRVRFAPVGGGESFELLTVHLRAGGGADRLAERKAQWQRALALVAQRREAGAGRVLLLGDVNSTGWLDDAGRERTFIQDRVREAQLEVGTGSLACSTYWDGAHRGRWEPNVLDHVVGTLGAVREGSAQAHGYCAQLACRTTEGSVPSEDYTRVSDHCPVTVELAPSP